MLSRPLLLATLALLIPLASHAETKVSRARSLVVTGRYADAQREFERMAAQEPVAAAIGVARCRAAVGQNDEAIRGLTTAATQHPGAADVEAELAGLEFQRGDYNSAQVHVDAAI